MFLLVPAHPGFPGQIPQSRKTVVCVCVYWCNFYSNRSTFEKVIEKIQRGPDFMEHGVVTPQSTVVLLT